ncbi:MAG: hypothetical protein PHW10_04510 [Candidatus Peribacteraceae bacterium]|nr:hypothetical protein [Candidatus Peribacteraceae bacterium]
MLLPRLGAMAALLASAAVPLVAAQTVDDPLDVTDDGVPMMITTLSPDAQQRIVSRFVRPGADTGVYDNSSLATAQIDLREYLLSPCFDPRTEEARDECELLFGTTRSLRDILLQGELYPVVAGQVEVNDPDALRALIAEARRQLLLYEERQLQGTGTGGTVMETAVERTLMQRSRQVWDLCSEAFDAEEDRNACFQRNIRLVRGDMPVEENFLTEL